MVRAQWLCQLFSVPADAMRREARLRPLCGRSLESPGHICAFFDSREQQYDVLSPYYKEGLDSGEEVVTIVDLAKITGEMMMDILSTHPYVIHRQLSSLASLGMTVHN